MVNGRFGVCDGVWRLAGQWSALRALARPCIARRVRPNSLIFLCPLCVTRRQPCPSPSPDLVLFVLHMLLAASRPIMEDNGPTRPASEQ